MSEEQTTGQEKGQPPLQTLRDGAVNVKLWRQESPENGAFVTAMIGRTYKDPETGEYRESRSLSGADMLRAQALLGEAHREAGKWRQHFRENERQQGAPEPEAPEAVAARDAALEQHGQAGGLDSPGLAQQRDAAMANAAPATPKRGPQREPQR